MCLSSYYELRPCRPKIGKLRELLAECPYRGPEYEKDESVGVEEEPNEERRRGEDWNGEKEAKRRKIDEVQSRKVIIIPVVNLHSFSLHIYSS